MKHPNFEVCYWETSTRWELTMILAVYEPFMEFESNLQRVGGIYRLDPCGKVLFV